MSEVSNGVDMLIDYIGGESNVESVSHCATRLRFVVSDMEKVDSKRIEELNFVNGSFYQGGQFQVIIGNEVDKYYSKIVENGKIKLLKNGELDQQKLKKISWIQKITGKLNKK